MRRCPLFFFFLCFVHISLLSPLLLWYSFALARCRAYPAVPIRRSGTARVHHPDVHPKPGTGRASTVNSVFHFFANWLVIFIFFFPNGELFQKSN